MPNKLKLFCGNANKKLAEDLAKKLKIKLGKIVVKQFEDGEIYVKLDEKVRGDDIFIIQPTCHDVNRNLMELLIMIETARRASARRITAVVPYFGYSRQDRKASPREPITAKLVANLLTKAGTDRIMTADLHADQIQGFFDMPVDHVSAMFLFANYFLKKKHSDVVVVAPDTGSVKRTRRIAKLMNAPLAIIDKRRPKHNVAEVAHVIGDVKNKTAILVDDIIDTAGTITVAADAVIKEGAKEVYICATHAVLSKDATKKIQNCKAKKVLFTDSIPIPESKMIDKIEILSLAPILAAVITAVHEENSIGVLFEKLSDNVSHGKNTKINQFL